MDLLERKVSMGGVTNKQNEEPEEVVEEMPRRRKGLIFSSSIGKHTDVEKLSRNYKCDFSMYTAYYIERNAAAREPEKNLVELLEDKMDNDVDIVVLQIGTNEISDLNLNNSPTTLQSQVLEQSKTILGVAQEMSSTYGCEVFVSQ